MHTEELARVNKELEETSPVDSHREEKAEVPATPPLQLLSFLCIHRLFCEQILCRSFFGVCSCPSKVSL